MSSPPARYAVIGNPIAHSLSPVMQQAAFDALGINASYEAIEASQAQARSVTLRLREGGFSGWNVTTPLKEAVLPFVDRLTAAAAAVRAVNVVRRERDGTLCGHNTDGAGFVHAMSESWPWNPRGATVLILGSGPAARSIAVALRGSGVAHLWCWSRNAARAREIGAPIAGQTDVVVSALPADASLPDEVLQAATDETIVFDLNYGVAQSPVAHMPGRRRCDGLLLLLYQGALSFEWWTGKAAPIAAMRAALVS